MEIIIAETTGFCSGVRKAIQGTKRALKKENKIYCLGDIIHNPGVVQDLRRKGMVFVKSVNDIEENTPFVIRSHGLPSDTVKKIESMGSRIYDFTCPKVKKSHRLAVRLTKSRKNIVIVGNPEHPEVKAIYSLTSGNAVIIDSIESIKDKINAREYHVIVQTTFMPEKFYEIIKNLVPVTKTLTVHNTLCEETIKRQQEVKLLAEKVDLIVVVGGKHSSNTKTLFAIADKTTRAIHIENANEITPDQLQGIKSVGIVSGASTPDSEVKKVYKKLLQIEQSKNTK